MSLAAVWNQVERLLADGMSIIPIRDKEESVNGKVFKAKTPYSTWAEYQHTIISKELLWHEMEKYNTSAVAIVCGAVSGNLEVIDIDVKYKAGINAILFKDLQDMFPLIYDKLRRHSSPSTGNHILFRVAGMVVPGNKDLAGRNPNKEELSDNPKAQIKWFIQTRGEGGYVLCPPSMGYSQVNDVPIPILTLEERECILNLCRNYNEVVKEPPQIPIFKNGKPDFYYDENPYVNYSNAADPNEILSDMGWTFVSNRGKFIWFTQPGGTKGNVHGSFNTETHIFQSFTPNAGLEERKGYFLATLLIDNKFDKDKKKAYAWLVEHGYGKVNHSVEAKTAKKLAETGSDLPANFSEEARIGYEQFMQYSKEIHPYGIFWEVSENEGISISREKVYAVSTGLGFRLYDGNLYQLDGKLIHSRGDREFYDIVKSYIHVDDVALLEDICNKYESFIEIHGRFTIERLPIIKDEEIIFDRKDVCFKFYKDKYLHITRDKVVELEYDVLDKLVFANKVQDRPYRFGTGGKYIDYLNNAVELGKNRDHVQAVVGYYAHDYNDETMGYMVILIEKCQDPKDGGRSGKNIFCKLLKYTTTVCDKAGSQTKLDQNTFQTWNGERVFSISDLPPNFDLTYFKNISTGGFVLKKLFKDEMNVPISKSPKIIFSTNYSFVCSDGGLASRVIAVEFTDFFKKMGGVDRYYNGTYFPNDWNEDDWAGFDWFVISSVQKWLASGCKMAFHELSETGWMKQFRQTYGDITFGIIMEFWDDWVLMQFVSNEKFKIHAETYYNDNQIGLNYSRPTSNKMNKALADFCKHTNFEFKKDYQHDDGFGNKKGRLFKKIEDAPF